MRVIYKYPLQVFSFDFGQVDIPEGEVVHIGFQENNLYAWVNHEKDEILTMRLCVIGTGHEFNDENLRFLGTAIGSEFVWHVFRVY